MEIPYFRIGNVPIFGNLILAPMDGYSDQPFRVMARKLGSAISYTEFINGIDVIGPHPHLNWRVAFQEIERPIAFQILENDPERFVAVAQKLISYRPDIIDINLGCSANSVVHRGAGAGLLKEPKKIGKIIKTLTMQVPVPITAKVRLGWDEQSKIYLDIAHIIEDNGALALAVHGRTRSQGYTGLSDWDAIAQIKSSISIPVIGNGDVRNTNDVQRMLDHTHCDAVMIGRSAISNPWIFSLKDRDQIQKSEVFSFLRDLLRQMVSFYGEPLGIIRSRKFIKTMLHPFGYDADLMYRVLVSVSFNEVMKYLDDIEYYGYAQ